MPLTLRTMLELDTIAIGRPEILAAADRIDRPVRWVHVTEVDNLDDILGGHEVVLTTGLPITGATADPRRFIQQLADANSCGVVVELGSRLTSLPAEFVADAERFGVPVVALHAPVRFVSITEVVHRLIVGEQYQGLEFAQRTHEVFTNLSLDSADAPTILQEAAELINGPVVLEDLGHRVVALAQHGESPVDLLRNWEQRSRRAPALDEPGTAGPEDWLTCPVGLRGATWGRLVAPDQVEDRVSTGVVMQRAAQALQLSRLVERDTTRLQFQAQESLLQELVEGRIQDESDGLARAQALGMMPTAWYLPVVVQFEPTLLPDQIARQRRARTHLEQISEDVRTAQLTGIAGGVSDGSVGVILALRSAAAEQPALTALSKAITARDDSRPGARRPVIGVGRARPGLLAAAALIRPTVHIAEAARALLPSDLPWFRSTDVRLRGLIAQLQEDERLVSFAESELAPLLAHEAEHRSGMVDLLRWHIQLRGNKAALAEASHISRQALYARLAKLETLLGVDLSDADSTLSLGVALMVHDIRTQSQPIRR